VATATAPVSEVDARPDRPGALPPERQGQRGTGSRVLVLNASYEPINVCTVRRAVVLVLKQRAEVLERSDRDLHAESLTVARPAVIRLTTYVRVPPTPARSPAARSSRATAGPASTAEPAAARSRSTT